MGTLLKRKRWNRILGKILLLCLAVNTIMGHGNLYAYAGNQTDLPLHKTISVTEKKISKAFEGYDGEEPVIKNGVIPFKGSQKERARETLESLLFGMVIVSQSRLGDNCSAIVAARSGDEYGDGASIDEVLMIGLNGNEDRDCEFTLEIVSEGGITAGFATVTGYRAEDFEEEENASDSDAGREASPSEAERKATPFHARAAAGNQSKAKQADKSRTEKKAGAAGNSTLQPSLATPSEAALITAASPSNAANTAEAEEDDGLTAGEPFEEYYTREWKQKDLVGLVIQKEGISETLSHLLDGKEETSKEQEAGADQEAPEPPAALSRSGDITAVNVVMEEAGSEDHFAHFSVTAASDEVQAGEWMEFLASGSVDPVETIRGISGKAYFTLRFEPDEEAEGEEYIDQMEGPDSAAVTEASQELDKITGYLAKEAERYPLEAGESWEQQPWYQVPSQEDESQYYYYNPRQRMAVIPIETGQTSQLSIPFAYPAQLTPDGAALTAYAEYLNADEIIKTGPGAVGYVDEGEARIQNTAMVLALGEADLIQYIDSKETDGANLRIIIADQNGTTILPDADGNYTDLTAGTPYQFDLTAHFPHGMDPGTYYYQFPEGVNIESASGGNLILKDIEGKDVAVGSWKIENAKLLFEINDSITNFTDVTLTATASVDFNEGRIQIPISQDGSVTITVKPNETDRKTEINKWASDKSNDPDADPDKIYWRAEIRGKKDSDFIGKTLTDQLIDSSTHYYTKEDMEAGIAIEAYRYQGYDYEAGAVESHKWTVKPGDPGFQWTADGWSYTMPETILCEWHYQEEVTLGMDTWLYYLKYTSTKKDPDTEEYTVYKNGISVDGASDEAETSNFKPITAAGIVKEGVYNEADDTVSWTITADIPGSEPGGKFEYFWYLWDAMKVIDSTGETLERAENDMGNVKTTVTAVIKGRTQKIPNFSEATADDEFCWDNHYSSVDKDTGTGNTYGREIDLWHRCNCTEETCQLWEKGGCSDERKGFCRCWGTYEDITFTFTYTTTADQFQSLINKYGGQGAKLYNEVSINRKEFNPATNDFDNIYLESDSDTADIPGMFIKRLAQTPEEDNGFIAEFNITVNEPKKDLSDNGKIETIRIDDTMSQTLLFLPATLVIRAEDAEGNQITLLPEQDYDYQTGAGGSQITIILKKLGAYQYTITYDASYYWPGGSADKEYHNTATVELLGETYSDAVDKRIVANAAVSGANYGVTIEKIDEKDPRLKLEGAEFGLFTGNGTMLCTVTTGSDGTVTVKTDTSKGILFFEHTDYYFQELTPPKGYQLESTPYHFWFCNKGESCDKCSALRGELAGADITVIYSTSGTVGAIQIANVYGGPELPSTGGPGHVPYHRTGILMMLASLGMLAGCTLEKRKRKQRG